MTAQTTPKIANAREYQITLDTIRSLERGLVEQETFRARRDPVEHWLSLGGMEGMLADLCQQAAAYNPADGRPYQATLSAIQRFESYLKHIEAASDQINPALLEPLRENNRSFLADLHTQAAAFAAAQRRNA